MQTSRLPDAAQMITKTSDNIPHRMLTGGGFSVDTDISPSNELMLAIIIVNKDEDDEETKDIVFMSLLEFHINELLEVLTTEGIIAEMVLN